MNMKTIGPHVAAPRDASGAEADKSGGVRNNSDSPVARPLPLLARRGTYLERQMMQNLDIVDYCLLAGAIVYFGLLCYGEFEYDLPSVNYTLRAKMVAAGLDNIPPCEGREIVSLVEPSPADCKARISAFAGHLYQKIELHSREAAREIYPSIYAIPTRRLLCTHA